MTSLFAYLRRPDETISRDNRTKALLATLLWFGLLSVLSVAMALLFASLHAIVPESPAQDLTTWKILCGVSLFPLFEELMFRLPLKRGQYTLLPALFLFAFYFISGYLHVERISSDRLVLRLMLSLGIMAAAYPLLCRIIARMNYTFFFYGTALLFGCMHLTNFGPEAWAGASTFSGALYLLWYIADKTAAGVLYGYARLKHGFFMAVLLHILNNSPLLLLLLFR